MKQPLTKTSHFMPTHMQINFLEAAGLILNDLSAEVDLSSANSADSVATDRHMTQKLQSFFMDQSFISLLGRVRATMAARGEPATGKIEIVIEPDGKVTIDVRRSNLQVHDQEQIRREVDKMVYLLLAQHSSLPTGNYSLSLSL